MMPLYPAILDNIVHALQSAADGCDTGTACACVAAEAAELLA